MNQTSQTVTSDPMVAAVDSALEGTSTPPGEASEAESTVESQEVAQTAKTKEELSRLARAERARWQEKSRLSQERRQIAAEREAMRAEMETARSTLDYAKKDPFGYFEKQGISAEDLAKRLVQKGTPEEAILELRSELAKLREEREDEAKRQREEHSINTRQKAEHNFASLVYSNEDTYPALTDLYTPRQLVSEAYEVAVEAHRRGYEYSDKEIAAYLERREAPRHKKLLERHKAKTAGSKSQESQDSDKPGDVLLGRQATKTATRTLTNGAASQKGSKAPSLDELPEKEQNRILAESYRKAVRG